MSSLVILESDENELEEIGKKITKDGMRSDMSVGHKLRYVWRLYKRSENSLKSSVEDINKLRKQQADDMVQVESYISHIQQLSDEQQEFIKDYEKENDLLKDESKDIKDLLEDSGLIDTLTNISILSQIQYLINEQASLSESVKQLSIEKEILSETLSEHSSSFKQENKVVNFFNQRNDINEVLEDLAPVEKVQFLIDMVQQQEAEIDQMKNEVGKLKEKFCSNNNAEAGLADVIIKTFQDVEQQNQDLQEEFLQIEMEIDEFGKYIHVQCCEDDDCVDKIRKILDVCKRESDCLRKHQNGYSKLRTLRKTSSFSDEDGLFYEDFARVHNEMKINLENQQQELTSILQNPSGLRHIADDSPIPDKLRFLCDCLNECEKQISALNEERSKIKETFSLAGDDILSGLLGFKSKNDETLEFKENELKSIKELLQKETDVPQLKDLNMLEEMRKIIDESKEREDLLHAAQVENAVSKEILTRIMFDDDCEDETDVEKIDNNAQTNLEKLTKSYEKLKCVISTLKKENKELNKTIVHCFQDVNLDLSNTIEQNVEVLSLYVRKQKDAITEYQSDLNELTSLLGQQDYEDISTFHFNAFSAVAESHISLSKNLQSKNRELKQIDNSLKLCELSSKDEFVVLPTGEKVQRFVLNLQEDSNELKKLKAEYYENCHVIEKDLSEPETDDFPSFVKVFKKYLDFKESMESMEQDVESVMELIRPFQQSGSNSEHFLVDHVKAIVDDYAAAVSKDQKSSKELEEINLILQNNIAFEKENSSIELLRIFSREKHKLESSMTQVHEDNEEIVDILNEIFKQFLGDFTNTATDLHNMIELLYDFQKEIAQLSSDLFEHSQEKGSGLIAAIKELSGSCLSQRKTLEIIRNFLCKTLASLGEPVNDGTDVNEEIALELISRRACSMKDKNQQLIKWQEEYSRDLELLDTEPTTIKEGISSLKITVKDLQCKENELDTIAKLLKEIIHREESISVCIQRLLGEKESLLLDKDTLTKEQSQVRTLLMKWKANSYQDDENNVSIVQKLLDDNRNLIEEYEAQKEAVEEIQRILPSLSPSEENPSHISFVDTIKHLIENERHLNEILNTKKKQIEDVELIMSSTVPELQSSNFSEEDFLSAMEKNDQSAKVPDMFSNIKVLTSQFKKLKEKSNVLEETEQQLVEILDDGEKPEDFSTKTDILGRVANLANKNKSLAKDNEELHMKNEAAEMKSFSLQDELENCKRREERLKTDMAEMELSFSKEKKEQENQFKIVKDEKNLLQLKIQEQMKETEELKEQLQMVEDIKVNKESMISDLTSKNQVLMDELSNSKSRLEYATNQVFEIKTNYKILEEEKQKSDEESKNKMRNMAKKHKDEIERIVKRTKQDAETIENEQSRYTKHVEEIRSLRLARSKLNEENKLLEKKVSSYKKDMEENKVMLESLQEDHNSAMESLKEEYEIVLDEERSKQARQEVQLTNLNEEIATINKKYKQQQVEKEKLSKDLNSEKKRLKELEIKYKMTKEEKNENESLAQLHKEKKLAIQNELEAIRSESDARKTRLVTSEKDLSKMKHKLKKRNQELKLKEESENNFRKQITHLQESNDVQNDLMLQMKKELYELRSKHGEAVCHSETLRKVASRESGRSKDVANKATKVKSQNNDLKQTLKAAIEELNQL